MRTLLTFLAVFALVAAACGDDDTSAPTTGDPGASTSTTASTTTSTTESTSTTTTAPPAEVRLSRSCTSPDGITISYPDDWDAVSDCGQFGPAPIEEPEPDTDERTGVVSAFVDPVAFDEAAVPEDGEQARATTTVDGRRAVRIASSTTGDRLYPEGTEVVRWVVDLSAADEAPRTLFVDAVDVFDDVDFDRAVAVLDAMARVLDLDGAGPSDGDQVVARYAGGGIPLTVAAAGAASTPSTCLRLLEPDDVDPGIACVQAVDEPAGVSVTSMRGPSGPLTVGITGPTVFAVTVEASGEAVTFLPVPYPARDSLAFAFPVDPADITTVTLTAADGSVLAQVPLADARRPADG